GRGGGGGWDAEGGGGQVVEGDRRSHAGVDLSQGCHGGRRVAAVRGAERLHRRQRGRDVRLGGDCRRLVRIGEEGACRLVRRTADEDERGPDPGRDQHGEDHERLHDLFLLVPRKKYYP